MRLSQHQCQRITVEASWESSPVPHLSQINDGTGIGSLPGAEKLWMQAVMQHSVQRDAEWEHNRTSFMKFAQIWQAWSMIGIFTKISKRHAQIPIVGLLLDTTQWAAQIWSVVVQPVMLNNKLKVSLKRRQHEGVAVIWPVKKHCGVHHVSRPGNHMTHNVIISELSGCILRIHGDGEISCQWRILISQVAAPPKHCHWPCLWTLVSSDVITVETHWDQLSEQRVIVILASFEPITRFLAMTPKRFNFFRTMVAEHSVMPNWRTFGKQSLCHVIRENHRNWLPFDWCRCMRIQPGLNSIDLHTQSSCEWP